jgi:8-oxo-dGTP diphosphatase
MEPVRNSAKALILKDHCILVIKHVDDVGDWFTLPGGGQESGETLIEAVQRECMEEVGLDVEVGDLLFVREYIGKNHEFWEVDAECHQVEFIFDCSIRGDSPPQMGESPDDDQIDVVWLPLQEISRFRIYPKILKGILDDCSMDSPIYLGDVN